MSVFLSGRRQRGAIHILKASAAETASATHKSATARQGGSVVVTVAVTAASGTTPTMVVVVEGSLDGSTWFEIGRIGSDGYRAGSVGTAPANFTAAATSRAALTGPSLIRTRSIVAGTTPSFTYSVTAIVG